MFEWPVVPLCDRQLRDVRDDDILCGGIFRKCDVYRAGGGYDEFPGICERRLGKGFGHQFVVQLLGCPFDCFYCYVTYKGMWGLPVDYTSENLISAFLAPQQEVFHLMGGAPALYLEWWPDLIERLPAPFVFHSDFLLVEGEYQSGLLRRISSPNCLYAVNIKGVTSEDYEYHTRTMFDSKLFWSNFDEIVNAEVPFYLTFTDPDRRHYDEFVATLIRRYGDVVMQDAFTIHLIHYKALD